MPYKLGFAIPPLDDHGGVNPALNDLRSGLRNKGHEVHFFCFGNSKIPSGNTTHIINSNLEFEQIKEFEKIYKKVTKISKFDAFFANNIRTHRICVNLKIENLFLVFHQGAFLHTKSIFEVWRKSIYCKKYYNNHRLVGVSKGLIENIVKKYKIKPEMMDFIYNPCDKKRILTLADEPIIDIPNGDFILHAGRFHIIKRHDRLIRAFAKMDTDIRLVLLGSGEEAGRIRKLISEYCLDDRVVILGWKENPYPYIKKAKLVVLTSDNEGLPTILIESLMLRTPVVSTDCLCGPSEIMQGELRRFLVPLHDETLLAKVMCSALKNYAEISEENLYRFDIDNVCEKYIDIVEKQGRYR